MGRSTTLVRLSTPEDKDRQTLSSVSRTMGGEESAHRMKPDMVFGRHTGSADKRLADCPAGRLAGRLCGSFQHTHVCTSDSNPEPKQCSVTQRMMVKMGSK